MILHRANVLGHGLYFEASSYQRRRVPSRSAGVPSSSQSSAWPWFGRAKKSRKCDRGYPVRSFLDIPETGMGAFASPLPIRVLVTEPDVVSRRSICALVERESCMMVTCVDDSRLVSSIQDSAPDHCGKTPSVWDTGVLLERKADSPSCCFFEKSSKPGERLEGAGVRPSRCATRLRYAPTPLIIDETTCVAAHFPALAMLQKLALLFDVSAWSPDVRAC